MARVCGIDGRAVDALRVHDFFAYIRNIDEWRKAEQQDREALHRSAGGG